jgi:hypothetical protein
VIGYPLFERVFYLLAAGFDVYGSVAHQLHSRLYMDFLRMEGEANFITLLPKEVRAATVANWYRDARQDSIAQMKTLALSGDVDNAIAYRSSDPKRELFDMLAGHIGPALDTRLSLDAEPDAKLRDALKAVTAVRGSSLAWLPETTFLQIAGPSGPRYYTLMRDTGHLNVTHLLREKGELAPAENALTLLPGLVGAYPNAIYRLRTEDIPAFASALAALASETDYRRFADRYAVRRTSTEFWAVSDALQVAARSNAPEDGGLFDYNRLENR